MISRTTIIGAYEAKTRFSELLERVESGESLTITRHGSPIALLVPVQHKSTREERKAAIAAIRELSKKNRLKGSKLRDLIAEGRR